MSQFAPTPSHGAAYAVAIEAVGGTRAIGDCDTRDKLAEILAKMERLREWARKTQAGTVVLAYKWGTEKVSEDAKARLEVHENSRRVAEALKALPQPPKVVEVRSSAELDAVLNAPEPNVIVNDEGTCSPAPQPPKESTP